MEGDKETESVTDMPEGLNISLTEPEEKGEEQPVEREKSPREKPEEQRQPVEPIETASESQAKASDPHLLSESISESEVPTHSQSASEAPSQSSKVINREEFRHHTPWKDRIGRRGSAKGALFAKKSPPASQTGSLDEFEFLEEEEEVVEEVQTVRDKVHNFAQGKYFQALMNSLTVFALWGDDFLRAFLYKESDPGFHMMYFLTFIAFAIELTLSSIVAEDYKWSFFFWLDMVATVSLLGDISWFTEFITAQYSGSGGSSGGGDSGSVARAGRASRAGTKAGRVVRIIRLIRLLKVIDFGKLWKRKEEEDEETAKAIALARDMLAKSEEASMKTSQLGKKLSEQTTKIVICGVLYDIVV